MSRIPHFCCNNDAEFRQKPFRPGSLLSFALFFAQAFLGLCFAFLFLCGSWQSSSRPYEKAGAQTQTATRKSCGNSFLNTILRSRKKKRVAQSKFNSCELCAQCLRRLFVICHKKFNYAFDYSVRLCMIVLVLINETW